MLKLVVIVIALLSGWITTVQMRRRARRDRQVNGLELTSFNTWIKVEEAEKRKPLGE